MARRLVSHAAPFDTSRMGVTDPAVRTSASTALARPVSPALATTLFTLGLAGDLAVALSGPQFPFEDSTNNLARYLFLARAWLGGAGSVPPYVQTHLMLRPYLGTDLIGAALVRVLGPRYALHAIAVLVVCALPLAFWMLLRSVGRSNLAWSLVGVLLGMGFFTFVGFINYDLGLAGVFLWLAAWWPHRATLSRARMASLGLGLILLYLLHLSAPLIVLLLLAVDVAQSVLSAEETASESIWSRVQRRARPANVLREPRLQFAIAAVVIVGVLCLVGGMGAAPPAANSHGVVLDYPSLPHKLLNLASPFYVFSLGQTLVTIAVYGTMVGAFLWVNRDVLMRRRQPSFFVLGAGACALVFLIFPAGTPGTGYVDMRWLPPAFLLPFCAAESEGQSPPRLLAGLLLVGCLLHDAVVGRTVRAIDARLADYRAVLNELPPGSHVLPLIADHDRFGLRVFPYRHYAFWYVIDRDGRVPGLFNGAGEGSGRPRHTFMAYFNEADHLYEPGELWGTRDWTPLDWSHIDHDYDYIIEAGSDPRATRLIAAHARRVAQVGDVALFKVVTAGAGGPPGP